MFCYNNGAFQCRNRSVYSMPKDNLNNQSHPHKHFAVNQTYHLGYRTSHKHITLSKCLDLELLQFALPL